MLRWEKDINGYTGHWTGGYIGFEDDCPLYRVGPWDNGWYYDYLPWDDMNGHTVEEFKSAEEAMKAAEEYHATLPCSKSLTAEDFEPLSIEDLEDAHWDEVAHERMEIAKGLF